MIIYPHRWAFWAGIAAVSAGVVAHLPAYARARDMHYHMAGMPMDATMKVGMAVIVVGIGLAAYGLIPRRPPASIDRTLAVRTLDDTPIRKSHVALLVVMATAVTIDVMKPTTLAFVLPGMTEEYGLRSPLNPTGTVPAALFPLCALTGMVLGSLGWGWLGDRIGRRASILLAGVMFIATSICGAMPAFGWNLLMCFLMGAAVGGMLPIAFALLAETIPARRRSALMVLIGGDVAGAYILTSFLTSRLEPTFGWRILWLIGLPTGVLFILLNRWIPESPRFLIASGRTAEAEAVMRRFGARIVRQVEPASPGPAEGAGGFGQLFRRPLGGLTAGVALFGLGWGLVNNGFLLWLPTNLREMGMEVGAATALLASSALIGFPAVFALAWLYGSWSSKRTMVGFAALTAAALAGFAVVGDRISQHPLLLQVLIVVLLVGSNAILAMLTPYSAEVYPTRIRARGTGLAGMCARAGGLLGVGVVVAGIAPPSVAGAALLGAVPIALAALTVARYGVETRGRPLEQIQARATVGKSRRAGASVQPYEAGRSEAVMDYLVLGAGPAGLQLGYFLEQAGRDYLIVEAGEAPGSFFRTFPRHRRLISINKPHTGWRDPELNLRMDWNSLLSDGPRFTSYTPRYFPDADDMVRYLSDFAEHHRLRIRYRTRITQVEPGFVATSATGEVFRAGRVIAATGVGSPYIPDIPGVETAGLYGTVSTDPAEFLGQRVLVIGKGNSAFETADNLIETASVIHVAGPSAIRMAWRSHFVGHLRAVNNNLLDTYQLKAQNALLDGTIRSIDRQGDGYVVTVSFARANEVTKDIPYDRVIVCTGFRFDDSIFADGCRPALTINDRFPAQTSAWESVNVPGLYFAGTLTQVRDYRRSTSGFIHGFRYGARALHRILECRYHDAEWPYVRLPAEPAALMTAVIDRVNRTSALWHQFGVLCDVIVEGRYLEELPLDYVHDTVTGDYFTITLEYGPGHDLVDPFDITVGRITQSEVEHAAQGRYLHPVVRHWRDGELVAAHHVTENLENEWTSPQIHREPLRDFFAREMADVPARA